MAMKKIDEEGQLHGPRAVFVCGYPQESLEILQRFLDEKELLDIKIIPCRMGHIEGTVEEALTGSDASEIVPQNQLPPVMLWAGITHKELDHMIRNYKDNGMPRPIFATTTEHNLQFSIKTLIRHLLEDQREIREAQKKRAEQMKQQGAPQEG